MTVWSGTSGHMQVGINVLNDGYDTNTPAINVYVEYWVRSVNWGYGDNQRVEAFGNANGAFDYYFNVGGGIQDRYIGTITIYGQGQSYGGGPGYTFGARVTGAYDGSSPSIQIGWSLPARPPNVPGQPGIQISEVTSSSARVNVYPADPRGADIREYQVHVSLPGGGWPPYTAEFGGGSGYVTNLQPNTDYQAEARARNDVGWGPYAYSGMFRTGSRVPDAPYSFRVGNVGQTSADFAWNSAFDGGSTVNMYRMQIGTSSNLDVNSRIIDFGNVLNVTLRDLTPGVRYWARVQSRNGVGFSGWSNVIDLLTLAGTPGISYPANNATVQDGFASYRVSAAGVSSASEFTVQVARDSAFTDLVGTIKNRPGTARPSNEYVVQDSSIYLVTGTYYVRSRVTNTSTGYVTPWSGTIKYAQAHVPVATPLSHYGGETKPYSSEILLQYRFDDRATTVDYQTAYQIVVEINDGGTVILDSGKTPTTGGTNNRSVAVGISSALKNRGLRWRVRVWDRGDSASEWSGYNTFTLSDIPVVTILAPQSSIAVGTGSPTFIWDPGIQSGGKQAEALLSVYDATSNQQIWSARVTSEDTRITPQQVILRNESQYYMTIDVTDSAGLKGGASVSFRTSYAAPDPIAYNVDTSLADELGFTQVEWNTAAADAFFVSWKVYRRSVDSDYELIATVTNQNVREYRDYQIIAGDRYLYSVTQVATRSGIFLESPVGYYRGIDGSVQVETRVQYLDLSYYWLIDPDNPANSIRLPNVTSDPSTLEFESETYNIIGRGRHRDYGDELGYTGTLTCQVNSVERPSTFRLQIEALRRTQESYMLRTPFGRLIQVALGDIGWAPRPGTGTSEMGEMTIPYEEVK